MSHRLPITHELKIIPQPFGAVLSGEKCYEIRKADRPYRVRDLLLLREWSPPAQEYTGAVVWRRITRITPAGSWGLPPDVCVLGIEPLDAGSYPLPTPEAR
jgi:hypothetical protein